MSEIINFVATELGIDPESLQIGWAIIGFVFWACAAMFGLVVAYFWYWQRRYLDQITISKSSFVPKDDGTFLLKIRTLEILPWHDLIPVNPILNFKIMMALRRCTPDQSFIILGKKDMDVFQPGLISGTSKICSDGFAVDENKVPVFYHEYLTGATFEVYDVRAAFKVHFQMICEHELERVKDPKFCAKVVYERAHHKDRMTTLKQMAARRDWELKHTSVDDMRVVRVVELAFRQ